MRRLTAVRTGATEIANSAKMGLCFRRSFRIALGLAALLAAFVCTTTRAADLTVAGITLGAPALFKDCALLKPLFPNDPPRYVPISDFLCKRDVETLAPNWWKLTIMLPFGDKPAIMSSEQMGAYARDGRLVGVDFSTHGIATQSYDLDTLTAKYGPPTKLSKTVVQNKLGAAFESITAIWTLDGIEVTFAGTFGRLDEGRVWVDLPGAAELRAAHGAKVDKLLNPRKL